MNNESSFDDLKLRFDSLVAKMQSAEQEVAIDWLMTASEGDIRAVLKAHYQRQKEVLLHSNSGSAPKR